MQFILVILVRHQIYYRDGAVAMSGSLSKVICFEFTTFLFPSETVVKSKKFQTVSICRVVNVVLVA
jgi:hypothetical protein